VKALGRIGLAVALAWAGPALAQSAAECGDLRNAVGPYDYRTASRAEREIVENYHFTPKVQTMQSGETGSIGSDVAYLLKAFPNHPRGLYVMAEQARRERRGTAQGAGYSVSCWFERAIRFRPDDGNVRIVFGIELLKDGKRKEAAAQLDRAIELIGDDPNAHYNAGLAYFDLGNYPKAREHAKKAYALGFSLPGLRNKLEKAGQWSNEDATASANGSGSPSTK
jgi:tetratricopeptide (TPR) repeat protein